jgi:undecaprenyl-diphosphatase
VTLIEAIILGIVQGATEYLPVSSSGHLVLVPMLFGFEKAPFAFDVLIQLGTLVGVIVYYFTDLAKVARDMVQGVVERKPFGTPAARFGWLVGVATIPAGVIGIALKDTFEEAFGSARATSGFLLVTATLLVVGEFVAKRVSAHRTPRTDAELRVSDAFVVGFAQALALFPGVSRSGSTIAAGMMVGLSREGAAKLSFVMSIPVMVGAGLLAVRDLVKDPSMFDALLVPTIVGFTVSAVTGYIVIKWFLGFVKGRSLAWFAAYCVVVGTLGLIFVPAGM